MIDGLGKKLAELVYIIVGILISHAFNLKAIGYFISLYIVYMELVSIAENCKKLGVDISMRIKKTEKFNILYADEGYDGLSDISVTTNVPTSSEMFTIPNCSYLFQSNYRNDIIDKLLPFCNGTTNTSYMFQSCNNLTTLDLSSFDFTKVTSFSYMFQNCGISCLASAGAYADGIPYIYVKDETAQNWILTKSNGKPSTWSTANVIIKEV